jgi:hypothetical protein
VSAETDCDEALSQHFDRKRAEFLDWVREVVRDEVARQLSDAQLAVTHTLRKVVPRG